MASCAGGQWAERSCPGSGCHSGTGQSAQAAAVGAGWAGQTQSQVSPHDRHSAGQDWGSQVRMCTHGVQVRVVLSHFWVSNVPLMPSWHAVSARYWRWLVAVMVGFFSLCQTRALCGTVDLLHAFVRVCVCMRVCVWVCVCSEGHIENLDSWGQFWMVCHLLWWGGGGLHCLTPQKAFRIKLQNIVHVFEGWSQTGYLNRAIHNASFPPQIRMMYFTLSKHWKPVSVHSKCSASTWK